MTTLRAWFMCDPVGDLEKLVKKIKEITCPKCESAEVGVFLPAEIFNCSECQHEWRETDEH